MKWIYGRTALWLSLTVIGSIIAGSSTSEARQDGPEPGEILVNQSCLNCHDMRPIQMTAQDKDGWTASVNKMVGLGAMVKADDMPVLIDYLVQHHGPLPPGDGRAIMLNICTMCHELDRVRHHHGSAEEWEALLVHMIGEGAPLSDEEFPILLDYLARNFRR